MSTPGLIIAAPRSGAGKTTVALGLMSALTVRGQTVQPFKCGPDYIDPGFHAAATGRRSFNLDSWAMSEPLIARLVADAAAGSELAIAEGAMGLFDGAASDGLAGRGATADIAARLGWPVVMVLDVSGQTETAAAIALGCARYRGDVTIAGVILNRVASARHAALIMPGFERIGMRVFGALLRDESITLPERHLGLVQAEEHDALHARLGRFGEIMARSVDLDAVMSAAKPSKSPPTDRDVVQVIPPPGQRIALAQDRAFSFIYPHLIEAWRSAGAEILPFSPLADEAPDQATSAVWLPGGYPELHAGVLAAATHFREGLHRLALRGVPIHGECGGYMVLGEGLEDGGGVRHAMAGLLSLETSFARRRLSLGYRRASLLASCCLGPAGATLLGHEFHYAATISTDDAPLASCSDAAGVPVHERGARRGCVTGTFFHAISRMPEHDRPALQNDAEPVTVQATLHS